MAAPRIWPSTAVTVSASAISRITWLIPTPHRLTVYASAAPLPDAPATLVIGRLARPYPNGTFPRRIALTSPSARRPRRNRGTSPFERRRDAPDIAAGDTDTKAHRSRPQREPSTWSGRGGRKGDGRSLPAEKGSGIDSIARPVS